jgi:hypothetical protein
VASNRKGPFDAFSQRVVSPKYTEDKEVPRSILGFPIAGADKNDTLMDPKALASARHQFGFNSRIFDLGKPDDKKAYDEIMDQIVNRRKMRYKFIELISQDKTSVRFYLEWLDIEAVLPDGAAVSSKTKNQVTSDAPDPS